MAKKSSTDAQTLDLIKLVAKQKEEISKAERPSFRTNCSFSYTEGRSNDNINLQTVSDVKQLINIAAFILDKQSNYKEAAEKLAVESPPDFTWQSFTATDWLEDLKLRIGKVQIAAKKKKLEALEERLSKIVSPELRAKMELEAIQAELAKG